MLANRKNNKGFTLIELLMAIALSSIVLWGAFQGYYLVKKMINQYYQMVRLQNNIKLITHELYNITNKSGQLGCARADQLLYLHLSKKISAILSPLLFISPNRLEGLVFLKKTDPKLKRLLPHTVYARLKSDTEVMYTLEVDRAKIKTNQMAYRLYGDCQEIFILSTQDSVDYFSHHKHLGYIGNLSITLYYIAESKRRNNQDNAIYSLYKYTQQLGVQEVIEGVERLCRDPKNPKKIKILLTSVEGNPPLKQWLTVPV